MHMNKCCFNSTPFGKFIKENRTGSNRGTVMRLKNVYRKWLYREFIKIGENLFGFLISGSLFLFETFQDYIGKALGN